MFEGELDGLEFILGTGGEIGDGAVFDFALLAEGLAQKDAVIGIAVDRGFGAVEIHSEHNIIITHLLYKLNIDILSGYIIDANNSYCICYQLLEKNDIRNIR